MTGMLAIARREASAFFATPIGWIVLCGFTFIGGLNFTLSIWNYYDQYAQMMFNPGAADQVNVNELIVAPLFGFFAVIMMFTAPALTMRLVAEDVRQRSIDLLLTSPIGSADIVIGKFLGAVTFAVVLAATTFPSLWLLYQFGDPDTGVVLTNVLSFVLLTSAFMAAGLFASTLTDNQIVAFLIAFVINLFVWMAGWVRYIVPEGSLKDVVTQFSIEAHLEGMSRGVLHLTDLVYFLTFIGFFLFAAAQRVESLRWR